MTPDQAAIRQAVLDNSRAELLRELQASHRIIRNMLGLLSISQVAMLAERNARNQVDGEGITRAHEREAVIRRAGGAA
ncbi:hypothetical protein C7416_102187 [Cupriavidus phytorum]|uniref:Uncharacterized protein n=1 Tax=Cupriavidus phytorum TaxID=3024399 RepID=A0A2W7PIL1_9BURK|nr:hypothetical protein [Cupriavidus alkaliphilus]PZX32027.1 hypothetical protein C7416_102187 [Cupriavidus alkaliphilus]